MKKSELQWILIGFAILVAALAIRTFKITTIPSGITWDEAAIGYNGWSIWEIKRDEWLYRLPIAFKSFGDFKAPFAIYLVGFFTQIFGLNVLAIRLPFALAGIAAVAAMGWFAYEWRYNRIKDRGFVAISMAMIAFSPWHIHFSRAGFESSIALLWVIIGLAAWFRMIRLKQVAWLFVAVISFAVSLYTYHSAKLVVPLIGIVLLCMYYPFLWKQKIYTLLAGFLGVGLLSPLLYSSLFNEGATRLTQTSVVTIDVSFIEKLQLLVSNYLAHFTPSFLFLGDFDVASQGLYGWGILMPLHAALLILFAIFVCIDFIRRFGEIIKQNMLSFSIRSGGYTFPVLLILIGILPGALGIDQVPHTIRTLLALPGFVLLITRIIERVLITVQDSRVNQNIRGSHNEKNMVLKAVIGTGILIHILSVITMLHTYFTEFPAQSAQAFAAEYIPAMELSYKYATGDGYPEKDKIIISSEYGQPYIFTLFANKLSPIAYHNGVLIKYEFKEVDMGDLSRKNAVIFATQENEGFKAERADHVFYGPDGEPRFKVFVTE